MFIDFMPPPLPPSIDHPYSAPLYSASSDRLLLKPYRPRCVAPSASPTDSIDTTNHNSDSVYMEYFNRIVVVWCMYNCKSVIAVCVQKEGSFKQLTEDLAIMCIVIS
ncbi:hypothetical protein L1887_31471 [Cichorium endivia]|nr:hypothetical protein L1887_31471 [Cichorium endivia]